MKITLKPNDKAMTIDATISITNRQDANDLVQDIREAIRLSARSGGQYGTHRQAGRYRVIFNFHLEGKV